MLIEIKETYSLFETNSAVEASSELAKWNVKINDNYITNLTTQVNTFKLGDIKWDSKEHVVAGKAAPGSIGYFSVEIDPTDTQVSFIYEIIYLSLKILIDEHDENAKSIIRTKTVHTAKYFNIAQLLHKINTLFAYILTLKVSFVK